MFRVLLVLVLSITAIGTSLGQSFPERAITMIVPYSAGGPADTLARPLAAAMTKALGQQVVIENVTGAGGTLGTARTAKATPDGYTVLIHNLGLPAAPQFFKDLNYDTESSLATIGLINSGPMVLIGRKDFPAKNAGELWKVLKEQKTKISMGHAGQGANSHLCGIILTRALDIEVTFIPYRGTGPAMQDLLAGQVDLVCDQSTTAVPQIASGNVKAFVVTGGERIETIQNVPTATEAGLPAFSIGIWHGLYAPRNIDPARIHRMNEALQKALADPSILERFRQAGTSPFPLSERSPESHRKKYIEEIRLWGSLMAGMKDQQK